MRCNKFKFLSGISRRAKFLNKPFLIVKRNDIPEAFFICKDQASLSVLESRLRQDLTNEYDNFLNVYDLSQDTHLATAIFYLAKEDSESFMEIADLALYTSFDNLPVPEKRKKTYV